MARKKDNPIITLTTDFGLQDHYVACMKGVILQIAPDARIVDVTHEIEPQNILGAAFVLGQTLAWYPPDTIHVVVVDPGVGTSRRIIAARYGGQTIIAPDNGIISFAHQIYQIEGARFINNTRLALAHVSNTFHGRDIMAPAAAYLSAGCNFSDLGPPTDHVEVLQVSRPESSSGGVITGQVIHIDRFGNLLSNISQHDLAGMSDGINSTIVSIGSKTLGPLLATYSDVSAGKEIALISSSGFVEIAVHLGNAKDQLQAAIGTPVVVERKRK